MMQVSALYLPLPFHPFRRPPSGPGQGPDDGWRAWLSRRRASEAGDQLQAAWAGLVGGGGGMERGILELSRGQQANLSGRAVSVEAGGGMAVGGQVRGAAVAVGGPCGTAVGAAVTATGGLRLAEGKIVLPDGRSIPFGNRGVIVRMPDGSQVAVGRSGDGPGAQACRWVAAGPGEEIPVSPPGATQVYDWDGAGGLKPAGVR